MRSVGSLLSVLFLALPAQAGPDVAVLEIKQGEVLINTGHGFRVAESNDPLAQGARVLVRNNTTAVVNYIETGCTQTLAEPGLYVVKQEACVLGESNSFRGMFQNTVTETSRPIAVAPLVPAIAGAGAAGSGANAIVAIGFAGGVAGTFVATEFIFAAPVSED